MDEIQENVSITEENIIPVVETEKVEVEPVAESVEPEVAPVVE